VLDGAAVRRSLDLTNWEAANRKIRELEIHGDGKSLSVHEAVERFMSERKTRKLSDAMYRKYRHATDELAERFGELPLRAITFHDLIEMQKGWKFAPITVQKRLELIRKFFLFAEKSELIEKNPAKDLEGPIVHFDPTLPFTNEEMEKILWAAEAIREAHPKIPIDTPKKLKALILLMRYSGIRISDAVMFNRSSLKEGKLFLRQVKTKEWVWVPLPKFVVKAIMACDEGSEQFFYRGVGTPKSAITEWQQRLKLVYQMAGVRDGHSHRLRDTFSVSLLDSGVSVEIVSRLLGHKNIAVTQRHYAPFVKSSQDALEKAVKKVWAMA
jgi:integrase